MPQIRWRSRVNPHEAAGERESSRERGKRVKRIAGNNVKCYKTTDEKADREFPADTAIANTSITGAYGKCRRIASGNKGSKGPGEKENETMYVRGQKWLSVE